MARLLTPTENDVKAAVLDYLSIIPGIHIERQNTGAMMVGTRFVRFNKKGASDLRGCIAPEGVSLIIELKRPGKKPTPDQEEYLLEWARHGAVAIWVDSAEMCSVMLRLEFQRRGWTWEPCWTLE